MPKTAPNNSKSNWRNSLHEIIFEADTPAGKIFDIVLIATILLSVVTIMLESITSISTEFGFYLRAAEWFFTILFSLEYILRLMSVQSPSKYARSFFGLVDLFSVLPTYLSIFLPGSQYFLVIRTLRIIRVFRVLKLVQYLSEAQSLARAMRASKRKILVFLYTVMILVLIVGSLMYLIEGEENGFTSIPRGVYWAIVTLTTVGYGDITPNTILGQFLASFVMIMGYGIIAVPTGIVTTELAIEAKTKTEVSTQCCPNCSAEGHDNDAEFCKFCGTSL